MPELSLLKRTEDMVRVALPRFDEGVTEGGSTMVRGVPVRRVGGRLVTTVFDLMLAQYGVARPGLPGVWPLAYDDASQIRQDGSGGRPVTDKGRTALA